MGLKIRRKKSFMEGNKYLKIVHILETYPTIPFILIGNAAEIDTDIYLKIAGTYPGKQCLSTSAVLIKRKANIKKVEDLIEKNRDIDVVLIRDSNKAITHARDNEFVGDEM